MFLLGKTKAQQQSRKYKVDLSTNAIDYVYLHSN